MSLGKVEDLNHAPPMCTHDMDISNLTKRHYKFHQKLEPAAVFVHSGQVHHHKYVEDANAFVTQLQVCARQRDLQKGTKLHANILESKLLRENIFVGSALVNMYAKCGAVVKAKEVFDVLQCQNVFSWTALISGYAQHGQGGHAILCFERMKCEALPCDAVTFACTLKACGSIAALDKGKAMHAEILCLDLLLNSKVLGNALVDMYAKCGATAMAQQVFSELPSRDAVSWNALITGYCQKGSGEEALSCYELMKREGIPFTRVTLLCMAKACGSVAAAEKGKEIHDEMVKGGFFEKNVVLHTAIMDMYAKCGSLEKAQQLFDELPVRDLVSWNALIAGYCQHSCGEKALNCVERMKDDNISPDGVTFACILKAYGSLGAAEKVKEVHDEVLRQGLLGKDKVLGTTLVDMYGKCGELTKAQQAFDELPAQDVVSWNALIAGYCQHGHGEKAINCFERMKRKGPAPNTVTLACIFKACGSIGAVKKGMEIHARISREGASAKASMLGSAVVEMYAKCGAFAKAQEVFDRLSCQDVGSWTALISGYSEHGHGSDALTCFERMVHEGLSPDAVTFACILKACGSIGAAEKGQTYYEIMDSNYGITPTLEHHIYMVDLLGGAGHIDKAMVAIQSMPTCRNLHAAFALLGACRRWGNVKLGKLAFNRAVQLSDNSAAVYVSMSNIYASAGMLEDADMALAKAKEVFDNLPVHDVVSWNSLIAGLCERGNAEEALNCYDRGKHEGLFPNSVTFLCLLKACGNIGAAKKGKEIHDEMVSVGLLGKDSALSSALVEMYAKCGELAKAQEVFKEVCIRSVIAWNSLIAGYCRCGHGEEALACYERMKLDGYSADAVTFALVLNACGSIKAADQGHEIHDLIVSHDLLGANPALGVALVDMYAKCGALEKARQVCDELQVPDLVSWNALLAGFCKHGNSEKVFEALETMKCKGLVPDAVTFTCILKSCSSLGTAEKGTKVHSEIVRSGLLDNSITLGSTLVDMYAKSGALAKAHETFDQLLVRDLYSWTALISGFCRNGFNKEALDCFEWMRCEGISPDVVTLACILKACNGIGPAKEGKLYFETVSRGYGIVPTVKHYAGMIELFGRAGQLDNVMAVFKKLPTVRHLPAWVSMLGVCKYWGNMKLGKFAFECSLAVK